MQDKPKVTNATTLAALAEILCEEAGRPEREAGARLGKAAPVLRGFGIETVGDLRRRSPPEDLDPRHRGTEVILTFVGELRTPRLRSALEEFLALRNLAPDWGHHMDKKLERESSVAQLADVLLALGGSKRKIGWALEDAAPMLAERGVRTVADLLAREAKALLEFAWGFGLDTLAELERFLAGKSFTPKWQEPLAPLSNETTLFQLGELIRQEPGARNIQLANTLKRNAERWQREGLRTVGDLRPAKAGTILLTGHLMGTGQLQLLGSFLAERSCAPDWYSERSRSAER